MAQHANRLIREGVEKHCLICGSKDTAKYRWLCKAHLAEYSLKKMNERAVKYAAEGHICPGCREFCHATRTYCDDCQRKVGKFNKVDEDLELEILEFVRRIPLKKFMVSFIEINQILYYFELLCPFEHLYDTEPMGKQVFKMYKYLVKWSKQMLKKPTYKIKVSNASKQNSRRIQR